MMLRRFVIVMAGGSGTRFWPASRAAHPKQLLALAGSSETLLQGTVRRAGALVGAGQVLVVASARHENETLEQLPELPRENLLLEPVGRNTAPCIAWASAHVRRRDPKAVIVALPADSHIADEDKFVKALTLAFTAAETGSIVTLGAKPTRAETGYGYLELGEAAQEGVFRVRAFVEKPTRERAGFYFNGDRHLWNCGVFCFRVDVMLSEIKRALPELYAFVEMADAADKRGDERALIEAEYEKLQKISIDYGVMERMDGILVVPASFGWDDVGSWAASYELATKDADRNAGASDLLAIDAQGCYVAAPPGKLVVLLGVRDLVVVDTKDALLVLPRERAQEVSKVVEALKTTRRDRSL